MNDELPKATPADADNDGLGMRVRQGGKRLRFSFQLRCGGTEDEKRETSNRLRDQ